MAPRQENRPAPLAALITSGRRAFAGFELTWLQRVPSTQDVVLAAAANGAAEGFCCVASEQTAGRGRLGRAWCAPPGTALLASVLLRPRIEALQQVTLAAGLAVCDALESAAGVHAELSWPNDVVVRGGKLAGILAETGTLPPGADTPPATARQGAEAQAAALDRAIVVGVGVNLRVDVFPPGATGISLHQLVPSPPAPEELLAELLPAVASRQRQLVEGGIPGLRPELRARSALLGRRVVAEGQRPFVVGTAVDIDDDGALVVLDGGKPVRVIAGSVRPAGPA